MKPTEKQLNAIKIILEQFERREYLNLGYQRLCGSFAVADMTGFDDKCIDIQFKFGIQDGEENTTHIENYTIEWDVINSFADNKIPVDSVLPRIQ